MAKMKRHLTFTGRLLLLALAALSQPLFASSATITGLNIKAAPEGDLLLITYEGNLNAVLMLADKEKHATLTLSQTAISPSFKLKKHSGKLIKNLKLILSPPSHSKMLISFKRRLGRHSKKHLVHNGRKMIQIELLDEVSEKPPKPSDKSLIQPVVERGMFEVDGSKEKKPLDYNKNDRKKIAIEEFLSLFGTQIRPRPNRITNITYELTDEKLKLVFSLHQRPSYSLKSFKNPPRIELKLTKTLGDVEIYHHPNRHDFLGNLTSTRNRDNTLMVQAGLYETTEASSKIIKNPTNPGYQLVINIKRIYPWETEAAIPEIDIR